MTEITRINLWRKAVPWWCTASVYQDVRALLSDPLSDVEFVAAVRKSGAYFQAVQELRHATMLEF